MGQLLGDPSSELAGRGLARRRERFRLSGELGPQPGDLGVQVLHSVVRGKEPGEHRGRLLAPGEDVVHRVAVASSQSRQVGPALLHLGQPCRVDVDVGEVRREVRGQIGSQVGQLRDPAFELAEGGVMIAHGCEGGPRSGQRVDDRDWPLRRIPLFTDEVCVGAPRREPEAVGVRQSLVLSPQGDVLTRFGIQGLDAVEASLEHVDLAGPLVRELAKPVAFGARP
jgi:hypothetical protein